MFLIMDRSVWKAKSIDEGNGAFLGFGWQHTTTNSKAVTLITRTRAARYRKSPKKIKRVELETLLLVEEGRKVTRESTISLYGKHYFIPHPGILIAGYGQRCRQQDAF